jgi:DNA-binding SARP family transcriptional activator
MLWADSDSSNVANVLHTTVKRARAFLGNPAAIVLTDDGYSLAPIIETDCDEVLRHYNESRQARKRNALFSVTFHYDQILKLSDRGVFMEGIYGPWLEGLRTRLTTIRRTAAIRLIQTELERGLLDRVEDLCHKLLAQDEFDEEALRGLLIVSARRRQPARLVRLFDDYSEKLKKEFRTDPSAELRSLYTKLTTATAIEE